jgi:hypothetical protein
MSKKPRQPRDPNQLAKLMVDVATGAARLPADLSDGKNPAAVALGKLGGMKGGHARARKLSKARRQDIAVKASAVRWKKTGGILVSAVKARRDELTQLLLHEIEQVQIKIREGEQSMANRVAFAKELAELEAQIESMSRT